MFIGLTVSPGFALINVTIITAITMHQLSGLFSRSKVFHTAGGQVKSIFPRMKSIPSSEPGCQLLSATGPNARGPDSSNRTAGQKLPPIQRDLKNAASGCISNPFHPSSVCLVTNPNTICVTNIWPARTWSDNDWLGLKRIATSDTPHVNFPYSCQNQFWDRHPCCHHHHCHQHQRTQQWKKYDILREQLYYAEYILVPVKYIQVDIFILNPRLGLNAEPSLTAVVWRQVTHALSWHLLCIESSEFRVQNRVSNGERALASPLYMHAWDDPSCMGDLWVKPANLTVKRLFWFFLWNKLYWTIRQLFAVMMELIWYFRSSVCTRFSFGFEQIARCRHVIPDQSWYEMFSTESWSFSNLSLRRRRWPLISFVWRAGPVQLTQG